MNIGCASTGPFANYAGGTRFHSLASHTASYQKDIERGDPGIQCVEIPADRFCGVVNIFRPETSETSRSYPRREQPPCGFCLARLLI